MNLIREFSRLRRRRLAPLLPVALIASLVLPPGALTSNPATVVWTTFPTKLAYDGATTADFHDPATPSATADRQ